MALRSRSRNTAATSGPGRLPGSDSRTRHRRRPPVRSRTGHRHASAEDLRRRAETLFGERSGERRELGTGPPPDAGEVRDIGESAASRTFAEPRVADPPSAAEPDEADAGAAAQAEGPRAAVIDEGTITGGAWQGRVAPALRERMPMWLQACCGLERRSVVALVVVLVVAAGFAVQHFWGGRTQSVRAPEVVGAAAPYTARSQGGAAGTAAASAGAPGAVDSAGAEIVVDVSGKVRKPGVHRLPPGSRVADALRAAGGVRPGTDTDGLNRARFLVDGEQVVVGASADAAGGGPGTGGPIAPGTAGAGPAAPVSLNTATVEQLDTLPGVGPVLARHIVDYRMQHGGFRSVEELRDVNGIGERRYADLRNLVRP